MAYPLLVPILRGACGEPELWLNVASHDQECPWYVALHYALSVTASATDASSGAWGGVMGVGREVFQRGQSFLRISLGIISA